MNDKIQKSNKLTQDQANTAVTYYQSDLKSSVDSKTINNATSTNKKSFNNPNEK
ncbi:hypothetical protein [Tepidibacter hydrothermalis]|uniref:Uncharacterized protein n=1 Tax=Tepidibacter hydrothermalis TaxID=3036126 RepID=A0ABY8E759_9FIRM|nr:hypothetical protein [Tepidibacter hydrothermalis]WFD08686.1 hypothetical protein P4S50_09755 [Tepidibacter hydrothermalis]